MQYRLENRDILYGDEALGPYPMHLLRRADKPTTSIPGPVGKRSQLNIAHALARRGVYGERVQKGEARLIDKYPLGASFFEIRNHLLKLNDCKNPVAPHKAPLPDDPKARSRHFKSLGYFIGSDLMGVCEVPPWSYYEDDARGTPLEMDLRYAIVFVVEKHLPTTHASDGSDWILDCISHQTYQQLAVQTETVANYIRRLGYNAEASNMRNYKTLLAPLLLQAGIGELSRMGIVINPFIGSNFKAAAVLTDMELEPDKPVDFGLQEYCGRCTICAEQCRGQAISYGAKELYNGYERWILNIDKCASFAFLNSKGAFCGRCNKVCPWNRPDTDPKHYAGWQGDMASIVREVDERACYLREHGFEDPRERGGKWWFDLEDIGGELVIPASSRAEAR